MRGMESHDQTERLQPNPEAMVGFIALAALLLPLLTSCTGDDIPIPRQPGVPFGTPAHFIAAESGEYREVISIGFGRGWFAADYACDTPDPRLCYDAICYRGTDWSVALPSAEWGLPPRSSPPTTYGSE